MAPDYAQANAAQRGLQRFAATGLGAWLFACIPDHGRPKHPAFSASAPRCVPRRVSVFVLEPRAG